METTHEIAPEVPRLRKRVTNLRQWLLVTSTAAVVLPVAVWAATSPPQPEPVVLGRGAAGLMLAEPSGPPFVTPRPPRTEEAGSPVQGGEASYYGEELAGNRTANGETFDPNAMTAAHRTLPFGSRIRVTNLDTGRAVVVRINDRGPYAGRRVIDLSRGAAEKVGMTGAGTAQVRLELLR